MTAYGTVESAVAAMKQGAYDYLPKPIDMKRLRALVQKAMEFQAVVAENSELRLRLRKSSSPGLLIGESEPMRTVARLIGEVANSDVTVLIEGESGTGKEIVPGRFTPKARARATVHLRQLRRAGRTVARSRTVRPRQRRFHRRGGKQTGPLSTGGRRHAVSGRDRRSLDRRARATCCACSKTAPFAWSAARS